MIKKFDEYIKESYNNFDFIKSRLNYYLINESQESKSQSEAIKLVMDTWGWDKEKADKFIRVDLRNDITPLRDKQIGKFTLGVTRMYCDKQITDANTISDINATLKLLTAHLNEYDRNLNGLSAEELISKFKQARENNVKKEKQEINRIKFGTSDYEIVKIDSFNDAKKYYTYTNPNSRWCLTYMSNMFDSYTCNGINQIYFCLRHGFEDVKQIKGENAPLDEYGLSMLSIIVNEEGELAYCTTRWNHANGGNDSAMDAVEISKVVNVNFYEVFKPNTKWKNIVDNAKKRLANGESPKKIFDRVEDFENGYAQVELKDRFNFINKNRELISDRWYDDVGHFNDGYVSVYLRGKGWNFINTEGKLLLDKWYDDAGRFNGGYVKVKLKDKGWNFINTEGKLLSDEWYDDADNFKDGYARVKLYNKGYNFINTKGKLLSDEWYVYDEVYYFNNGYSKVYSKNKGYNFINTKGKLLSDEWYDDVDPFNDGYARVKLNSKGWNLLNVEGNFLSDEWYDRFYYFKYGYAKVYSENKGYNFINTEGKLLSDKWYRYDEVYDFKDGYISVKLNNIGWNFINAEGKLLLDKWYDSVENFSDGYARVKLKDKGYNFINTEGKLLLDKWYDFVYSFKYGFTKVKLKYKGYNFINTEGKLVSDKWFDEVDDYFEDGYASVEFNDKYNFINTEGKLVSDKWFSSFSEANSYLKNYK